MPFYKTNSGKKAAKTASTKGTANRKASALPEIASYKNAIPWQSWLATLGATLLISAFFVFFFPERPWLVLSSHYFYFVWLVFVALYVPPRAFFFGAIGFLLVYPAAVFFLHFDRAGSLLSFAKNIFLPVLDMVAAFGLIYFYRVQNNLKFDRKNAEIATEQEKIERLKKSLQKERVKTGNLERNIRNQEYTFTLVYKLFKTFLEGTRPFEQVLRDNVARVTQAQKITIFRVNESELISIPVNEKEVPEKIALAEDPFFQAVCRLKRTITIPEIARSPKLFRMWKQSKHRGLIFLPILKSRQLVYLISIDQMPFHLFHGRTTQTLGNLIQMAEFSLHILERQQETGESPRSLWRQELPTPQLFLDALQHEFRRARRFQSSFSLIGIHVHLHEDFRGKNIREMVAHTIRSEIRELDQFYFDSPRQIMWIILPFTGFPEMSLVLNRIDERLSRIEEQPFREASFDYGFSIFETDMESPKTMLKQVVEVMQIHNKILQKMSRRHAYV